MTLIVESIILAFIFILIITDYAQISINLYQILFPYHGNSITKINVAKRSAYETIEETLLTIVDGHEGR